MPVVMGAAENDPGRQEGLCVGPVLGPQWDSHWLFSPRNLSLPNLLLYEVPGLSARTGTARVQAGTLSVSY